jgi:hypothetical protein
MPCKKDIGNATSVGSSTGSSNPDPDLVRVIASWATLPEPIRRAVVALIGTVNPER